jgi:glycosyl transferase family 25
MQTVPIYVINLERSPDRWELVQEDFAKLGLTPLRIDAVDGMTLDFPALSAGNQSADGRKLHEGEIACAMSHRKALETFLASDAEAAVILEDDGVLVDAAPNVLPWIANNMVKHGGWVTNLGPWNYKFVTQIGQKEGHEMMCAHQFALGAYGLMWTRAGAQAALARPLNLVNGWDHDVRLLVVGKNRGFTMRPPVTNHRGGRSDIDAVGSEKERLNRKKTGGFAEYFRLKTQVLREESRALLGKIRWIIGLRH